MLSRAEGRGLGYLWLCKRAGVCAKEACPPAPHSQRPPRGRGSLWEGWGQLVTQESRTSWRPSGAGARPCTSHSWVLGSCESLTWHKKEKKPGGVWTQRTRVMWHPRPRPSMPRRLNSPPSAALPSPEAQLPGIAVASGVPSTPRTGSQHVSVLLLLATLPPHLRGAQVPHCLSLTPQGCLLLWCPGQQTASRNPASVPLTPP